MKKFLLTVAVAAIVAGAAFAEDVTDALNTAGSAVSAMSESANVSESLQGVWFDKKFNCNWQFQVNSGSDVFCVLKDADTNAVIYQFNKNKVKNFRAESQTNSFVISWESEEKNRVYKFSKSISVDLDLQLDIFNNYYNERHNAKIKYVSADARVN